MVALFSCPPFPFLSPLSALYLPHKYTCLLSFTLLSTFPQLFSPFSLFIANSLPCSDLYPLTCRTPSALRVLCFAFYQHSLAVHTQISLLCFLKILNTRHILTAANQGCRFVHSSARRLETPYCPETPPLSPQPITLSLHLTAFQAQSKTLSLPHKTHYTLHLKFLSQNFVISMIAFYFPFNHFLNVPFLYHNKMLSLPAYTKHFGLI